MEKFRFLNWPVYKDAQKLFSIVSATYDNLPNHIKYSIGQQLIKTAFSIILNIAEGSGRKTDKELKRFFDISLGSCYELLACADTLHNQDLLETKNLQKNLRASRSYNKSTRWLQKINLKVVQLFSCISSS